MYKYTANGNFIKKEVSENYEKWWCTRIIMQAMKTISLTFKYKTCWRCVTTAPSSCSKYSIGTLVKSYQGKFTAPCVAAQEWF